jgi:GAF domain-containing protein
MLHYYKGQFFFMSFGKKRQCVEWYSSTPRENESIETYKNAILGFIEKYSISILIGALCLTGAPWWFPKNLKQINVSLFSYIILFIGIILIIFISISLVYNRSQKKSNILTSLFHDIIHKIRDNYFESMIILNDSKRKITICLDNIVEILCIKIKEYFIKLKRTDEIGVAIRLANKNNENKVVYETIGRANLNPERSKTSEAIPENMGIPGHFKTKYFSGIFIYNDIFEASEKLYFKLTENEKLHKEEIQSIIVAPLNCFDGAGKSMIGLLYITSRKKNLFESRDVEHIKALGDLIAIIISQIVYLMKIIKDISQGENDENYIGS